MPRLSIFSRTLLIWILDLVLAGSACVADDSSATFESGNAPDLVVGVSPFIPDAEWPAVERSIALLLLEKVPAGRRIIVYDAYHLKQVTDVQLPPGRAYEHAKVRAKRVKGNLLEIRRFFGDQQAASAGEGRRDARIKVPQFLDFVSAFRHGGRPPIVALFGSPLYLEQDEKGFSMDGGFVPTDDHLCVDQRLSVYGVTNKAGILDGLRVHFGALGSSWVSGLQEELVRRFWGLFIERQGGQLITFSGDLPTLVDRAYQLELAPPWQASLECRAPLKLAMVVPQRSTDRVEAWLLNDGILFGRQIPASRRGPLKIGIRWSCAACDLDLYSRPSKDGAELFYGHPKTTQGVYFRDFRSSPTSSDSYEWVDYSEPVDLAEVEAAVNFFHGQAVGGAKGEVRVLFDGGVYRGEFTIPASEGNMGKDQAERAVSRYWRTLDIDALVRQGGGREMASGLGLKAEPRGSEDAKVTPAPPSMAPPLARVAARPDGETRDRGVRILHPKDGSSIKAPSHRLASGPLAHPIEGDVFGFGKGEIERFGLVVEIVIVTSGEFEQGIAAVRDNGTWRLPTAWFGGARHLVRAVLKDANGHELATHEVVVAVVHY